MTDRGSGVANNFEGSTDFPGLGGTRSQLAVPVGICRARAHRSHRLRFGVWEHHQDVGEVEAVVDLAPRYSPPVQPSDQLFQCNPHPLGERRPVSARSPSSEFKCFVSPRSVGLFSRLPTLISPSRPLKKTPRIPVLHLSEARSRWLWLYRRRFLQLKA